MIVTPCRLPEVLLIAPRVFGDPRGFLLEAYHDLRYREAGIPAPFVQDNVSRSSRGVLRGLHHQHPHAQGKLVQALVGTIFDVAVDIRAGSPTFGQWTGAMLSAENHHQLYVPPGFAHGFVVLSDDALVLYKCTERYHPQAEHTIAWNDPSIGIEWPLAAAEVSERDRLAPRLEDVPREHLPTYGG